MSGWRCHCGHIIRDNTDNLPYKARFFADGDQWAFDKLVDFYVGLIQAREEGRQGEFLTRHFGEGYPQNLTLEEIVGDGMSVLFAAERLMYECENCGRLYLEPVPRARQLVRYLPESEVRGVLRPRKQDSSQKGD
jgi:hypothetical protein